MTRLQYCIYLLKRVAEASVVVALAVFATHYAQLQGWLTPARHDWAYRAADWLLSLSHRRYISDPPWLIAFEWWTWPVLFGGLAHIFFGPKQSRPIYLRIPGYTYIYGGIKADRNHACRGGLITGATGSGKSQVCFNPLFHSVCINEAGRELSAWKHTRARPLLEKARTRFRAANKADLETVKKLTNEVSKTQGEANKALDLLVADLLQSVIEWQALHPGQPFTPEIAGPLAAALNQAAGFAPAEDLAKKPYKQAEFQKQKAARKRGELFSVDRTLIVGLFERITTLQRLEAPAPIAAHGSRWGKAYDRYRNLAAAAQELDEQIASIHARMAIRRLEFQKIADPLKPLRYEVAPWGGLVADEKGNQWQIITAMFAYYDRDEDLMLLQTRPNDAPPDWSPSARFNVLSFDDLPADTYAKLIVDTGLAVEGGDKPDEFFVPQARDKIGWGIKLLRAVRDAQSEIGDPPEKRAYPAIDKILHILTTLANYNAFLLEIGAAQTTTKVVKSKTVVVKDKSGNDVEEQQNVEEEQVIPARLNTPALREARARLENDYWAQPDEQRGGVASTIYNFLVPFTEPDVAAVFCRDNTFDLRAVYGGKVVSVALPQKYAVQRRYVTAILKEITYQLIKNRFDFRSDQAAWKNRNFIWIPQDEFQRYGTESDTNVDTIREAQGTTTAGAQTQDSVWRLYGGKEKAVPMLANMRSRWVCTAATESCAEESARIIGKYTAKKKSYTVQHFGRDSVNVSFEDRYYIKPHQLMSLPAFHVVFAPAESRWLYKKMIVMPVTPDGKIPPWWFGDLNPLVWLSPFLGLRRFSTVIWPWQSKAPLRAKLRYIVGLDGTFITIDKLSRRKARKLDHKEH